MASSSYKSNKFNPAVITSEYIIQLSPDNKLLVKKKEKTNIHECRYNKKLNKAAFLNPYRQVLIYDLSKNRVEQKISIHDILNQLI